MANLIQRTNDVVIHLFNEQIGRAISIGSNWNRLRIGLRMSISGSGDFYPDWAIGVCSGTASMAAASQSLNFAGVKTVYRLNGPFLVDNTTYWSNQNGSLINAAVKTGSFFTSASNSGFSTNTYFAKTPTRNMFIVDIEKHATNYSMSLFFPVNATGGTTDASLQALTASLLMPTMSYSNYGVSSTTQAASEVGGALDVINIMWRNAGSRLEISDLFWVKLY